MEGQGVTTADIPGAFLQTDYNKGDIHINTEGAMVNLIKEVDPAYYNYSIYIDRHELNECMQNPMRWYTEL